MKKLALLLVLAVSAMSMAGCAAGNSAVANLKPESTNVTAVKGETLSRVLKKYNSDSYSKVSNACGNAQEIDRSNCFVREAKNGILGGNAVVRSISSDNPGKYIAFDLDEIYTYSTEPKDCNIPIVEAVDNLKGLCHGQGATNNFHIFFFKIRGVWTVVNTKISVLTSSNLYSNGYGTSPTRQLINAGDWNIIPHPFNGLRTSEIVKEQKTFELEQAKAAEKAKEKYMSWLNSFSSNQRKAVIDLTRYIHANGIQPPCDQVIDHYKNGLDRLNCGPFIIDGSNIANGSFKSGAAFGSQLQSRLVFLLHGTRYASDISTTMVTPFLLYIDGNSGKDFFTAASAVNTMINSEDLRDFNTLTKLFAQHIITENK